MDKESETSREMRYRLYCDERMAQQIRENSQELRELETRIRSAYVTKSLKLQLVEREKKRLQEKILQENEVQRMKKKLNDDLQRDRQLKIERQKQREIHRKELLQQIADKQFKRKILYEEFLKEKIIIDEIMDKIQKEQIAYDRLSNNKKIGGPERLTTFFHINFFFREFQEKLRKTQCLRDDIVQLIQEQEQWKKQQERIAAEENEKITEYIIEQEKRAKQLKKDDQNKLLAKIEQQEKMCSELDAIEVIT